PSLTPPLPGLVQRCVIIQKDENGFGLTVSGDNPVFVQLVKEGLVQRCVIIQKDENGFGLTVSGDNPVFVQLVKE
ncbi:rho guanine nucleotide exchange factor 12 isoform X1, partial [Tachysurus ichikawai]